MQQSTWLRFDGGLQGRCSRPLSLTSFSQNALFFAPFGSKLHYLARNTRIICFTLGNYVICFHVLLSFSPFVNV